MGVVAGSAAVLLFACGRFGAADAINPDSSAGRADGGPGPTNPGSPSEAGPEDGGGESDGIEVTLEDGGTAQCFDFTSGPPSGFTTEGEVTASGGGLAITMTSDSTRSAVRRTFHRDGGFAATSVGVDMTFSESTAMTAGQYVDTVVLYYGLPAAFLRTPQSSFELVDDGLEVDVWYDELGDYAGSYAVDEAKLPFAELNGELWIDTTWGLAGKHVISAGGKTQTVTADTASPSKSDLTVEVGGTLSEGNKHALTITLRRICVAFR